MALAKFNIKQRVVLFFLAPILVLGLSACSHFKPRDFSRFKEGSWDGKALIRDKKRSKSGIVNLKINAIDGEKLRMDFTSPVGSHLASVLMVGSNVDYLNVSDKSLYKTKATVDSFKSILLVPIEPEAFYSLLFDRPMNPKTWSCKSDDSGAVLSCLDKKMGLTIEWKSREGEKRTIGIQHKAASVQINLYNFESPIEKPEKAFNLTLPSTFRVKKI